MSSYVPERYQSKTRSRGASVMERRERWTTENDSQFFYPGFEPNHLTLKEQRIEREKRRTRHYNPALYHKSEEEEEEILVVETSERTTAVPSTPQSTGVPAQAPQTYADVGMQVTVRDLRCEEPTQPPKQLAPKNTTLKSRKALRDGRFVPDSSFSPPFHAYGWKNVNPIVERNYMKTHNAKPPVREVRKHVSTKRSTSIGCERSKAAEVEDGRMQVRSKQKDMACPPVPQEPVVIQVSDESKFVLLNDGKVKLRIRKRDERAALEATVKKTLQLPPTHPVVLNDSNGRPVILTYDTVSDGEVLHLSKHCTADALKSSTFRSIPYKIRDLPTAGVRTQPSDTVADCFEYY